jgi:hypothetical protein
MAMTPQERFDYLDQWLEDFPKLDFWKQEFFKDTFPKYVQERKYLRETFDCGRKTEERRPMGGPVFTDLIQQSYRLCAPMPGTLVSGLPGQSGHLRPYVFHKPVIFNFSSQPSKLLFRDVPPGRFFIDGEGNFCQKVRKGTNWRHIVIADDVGNPVGNISVIDNDTYEIRKLLPECTITFN